MYDYSSIEDNWKKRDGNLDKRIFNYLRQELEDVRYYSKCLDGTSYIYSQDLNDIYDITSYRDDKTYKIDASYSSNFNGPVNKDSKAVSIGVGGNSEKGFYNRYKSEYGFTLKNLFSPKRLFDYTNYLNVDLATTQPLNIAQIDIDSPLSIDGNIMVEGQRLLVKDNISYITLDGSIDPETYFIGNYYKEDSISSQIKYYYYNESNGIYLYTNNNLVRTIDLDTYSTNMHYSVYVKMGDQNITKHFHLSRLLKGYFPLTSNNEPIEFVEKIDYIVRNSLEYRNVLDNNFYDGVSQATQYIKFNDEIYNIPERMISVGDFGMIINYQDGYVNVIENKFKEDLKDIIEYKDDYLIVGNNGNLLSMDKINLDMNINVLDTFENLLSIDVTSNDRGIILGENGTILTSIDNKDWDILDTDLTVNLNKVLFSDISNANIVGNNGVYGSINLNKNLKFKFTEKKLNIKPNLFDERVIKEDLHNIENINVNNKFFKYKGDDWIDIRKDINSSFSFDFNFKPLGLSGSDDQVLFSFVPEEQPGNTASNALKGIKVLIRYENTKYRLKTIINDNLGNSVILDGDVNLSNNKWYHIFVTRYKNEYQLFLNKRISDVTDVGFESNFNNFNTRIRLGAELTYNPNDLSYLNTSYNHFIGVIDNVRLWETNLNNQEVFDYFNNYNIDLQYLNNWYKFNVIKENKVKKILTKDLINNRNLILPTFSNLLKYNIDTSLTEMIDLEMFKGISISCDKFIIFVLNNPDDSYYEGEINTQFYIELDETIKTILFNPNDEYYYGTSEDRIFRIDSEKIEFNLFNSINIITPEIETILETGFDSLAIDKINQILYLINGLENEIDKIDLTDICIIEDKDPLEFASVYISVSKIYTTNSIDIENDYIEDVVDNDNINSINYIKTLEYPSNQSVVEIYLKKGGIFLELYKELYMSVTVEEQINGYFEVSLNDIDYTKLEGNGDYLIPLSVGASSKLTIRAKLQDNHTNNKIKGIIKNILFYEAETIQEIRPRIYDNTFNVKKLYFSQFDFDDELTKLENDFLYSYIDLRSIKIDNSEKFTPTANYDAAGLPKYLYNNNFTASALSNCDGDFLCDFSTTLTNDTVDRIRYGLGISVNTSNEEYYEYDMSSYGLLEAFTINNVQTFGIDNTKISNDVNILTNPYYLGIDFNKDFYFEVESFIINKTDLLDSDITNGATSSQNVIITNGNISYGTQSSTYFNEITFIGSSTTYSITADSTLNDNQIYYVEMELNGTVDLTLGSASINLTSGGNIVKKQIRLTSDVTTFDLSVNPSTTIKNLVITDRLPTKSVIQWDKNDCGLSYKLNGITQTNNGSLLESGDNYLPSCVYADDCNNQSQNVLDYQYWSKFDSKLLFLDYDIASKLYFFDTETGEYQLPEPINISNINQLTIQSIDKEKSWIDYSRDATKDFKYWNITGSASAPKDNLNTIKYSNTFRNASGNSSFDIILSASGSSTSDIDDMNGPTSSVGIFPHLDEGRSIGTYVNRKEFYFYNNYMIFIKPINFDVKLGDILKFKNSLIDANHMVINIHIVGADTLIYCKTEFDQNIINRLIKWNKPTTITNLNIFRNNSELLKHFPLHPISIGYSLVSNDLGSLTLSAKFNPKTAYYNLECKAIVLSNLFITTKINMIYQRKIGSFGYSGKYNILSYLSVDSRFTESYKIVSLPEYKFSSNNAGVLYNLQEGILSFNSSLKNEWESIPKYTFLDIEFMSGSASNTKLESILVIDKYYSETEDRYIISTYDYFDHIYQTSDLNSTDIKVRVRNTLGEISRDLQKMNNIQQASSTLYNITDFDNKEFTSYSNEKTNLNFKPNTDSYAKALLSQHEIKDFLTGIVYIDFNNYLAVNIINLIKEETKTIVGIDRNYIQCNDCEYEDFAKFINPDNNRAYNQISFLGTSSNVSYTNREPVELYGYNKQIQLLDVGLTPSYRDIAISFTPEGTPSNPIDRTLEFLVEDLRNAIVEIYKGPTTTLPYIISTIGTIPNSVTKIEFEDNGNDDIIIKVANLTKDNRVVINDIRVGNINCMDDCYSTSLIINNHNLSIGDGLNIDIEDDIYELTNLYKSDFDTATISDSGWTLVKDDNSTQVIGLTQGAITDLFIDGISSIYYNLPFTVTQSNTYRLSFDYTIKPMSGTPSLNPAFDSNNGLLFDTEFDELGVANSVRVDSNFIATTSSIFIGFNMIHSLAKFHLTLNNIEINELTDRSKYYNGYNVITEVIDENTVVIPTTFIGNIEEITMTYSYTNSCGISSIREKTISEIGTANKSVFDPYLNYEPIDLFKLGNDNDIKKSIEITRDKWVNNNEVISLINLDMKKYRFKLIDNLTVMELADKYPWVLEAEVRDAVIGKDADGIVWYKGIWDCGRWFNGKWYSGTWRSGVWYEGTWFNSDIRDNGNIIDIKVLESDLSQSIWKDGTWFNGLHKGGVWERGIWYDGLWDNGKWLDGVWNRGTWNEGTFKRGTWIDGTWNGGIFSCSLGLSSWLDGTWNAGEFKCGHWYAGSFDNKNGKSIFGEGATLSRKAIWENGYFLNGEFNSGSNDRFDLSIWKTGSWNTGTWNGGTAHQINYNNGIWNDGVIKDIPIVAFSGNNNGINFFTLLGEWNFHANDTFWVINNETNNPIFGSDMIPNKYTVDIDSFTIEDGKYTKVFVNNLPNALRTIINSNNRYNKGYQNNSNPSDNSILDTYITKIVSNVTKIEWYNGRLENGIFDGRFLRNGLWYNGVFKSGQFGY